MSTRCGFFVVVSRSSHALAPASIRSPLESNISKSRMAKTDFATRGQVCSRVGDDATDAIHTVGAAIECKAGLAVEFGRLLVDNRRRFVRRIRDD